MHHYAQYVFEARREKNRFNNLRENIDEEVASGDYSDDGDEFRTIYPDHVVDDEQIQDVQQMIIN